MRNAEKDREIIAAATEGPWHYKETSWELDDITDSSGKIVMMIGHYETRNAVFIAEARQAFPHYLERAVSAEQRVAELEEFMRLIIGTTKPPYYERYSVIGHADCIDFAQSALKGANE